MIGQTVSHYKIFEQLGCGGMGIVYRAQDLKLGRPVALKFLPSELTRNHEAKTRFILEAKNASALDHPNICTIYELGETAEGQVFIAMACYEGETLEHALRGGPFKVDRAVTVAEQIASGLTEAHRTGIIHRDIKPANIILTQDGTPKIIDFGLAKLAGQMGLTRSRSRVGTPAYMSPEQIRGEEVDARTDLWSLGVVLYEMLTGRLPFAADDEYAFLYKILNEPPDPPTRHRPDITPSLWSILDRLLAKDLVERYQSARDLLRDLGSGKSESEYHPPAPTTIASIAVLPFEDMSPEHDQDYFCEGIAEELINALTHVDGLRVVARISSFAFKGKQGKVREIGRRLAVETILEGSIRKADHRLRVTVQLTSVQDESALWSERYDRRLEDIFAIQDDVCVSVVERLRVMLGRGERMNLVRRRANNHEAYNLYLKGRFLHNQRRRESIRKSIEYYSQAAAIDPSFALAYVGLAETYEVLGSWRELPPDFAFSEARRASKTALQLDDLLPEAHVIAGYVSLFCDWSWKAAEREFQRAITLNPACAEAHHHRAHYLEATGRFDLALSAINRAMELEPVAPSLNCCATQILFSARRYDEAVRQGYATLEMAPSLYGLLGWIGAAYIKNGLVQAGLAAIAEGRRHLIGDPRLQALYGTACAMAGDIEGARGALEKLLALSLEKYVDQYYIAWLHEALGNRDCALKSLEKAYDEHSRWMAWVAVDPLMDGLRAEPRYIGLIEKVGVIIAPHFPTSTELL